MVFSNDMYFIRDLHIFLQLNNKKAKKKKSNSKVGSAFSRHFFKKKKKRYTVGREAPKKMFNIISH